MAYRQSVFSGGGGGGGGNAVDFCQVRKSASQTINNGAEDIISWDVDVSDVDGQHDPITNNDRIYALHTGPHILSWVLRSTGAGTGNVWISVYKNGVGVSPGNQQYVVIAGIIVGEFDLELVAGDYVYIDVFNTTGASIQIVGGAAQSSMTLLSVGAS